MQAAKRKNYGFRVLALGYQIFMGWVANRPAGEDSEAQGDPPAAN